MRYRMIYLGLAALAVAVVSLGIAFTPEGEVTEIPAPIESVVPAPNGSVIRQTTVEVDLEFGYEATIFVDGFALPENEVTFVEATGVYRWAPGPASTVTAEWEPGEHTVRVEWARVVDSPVTGTFEWSFRVQ
jgi:hypothetical protein